ncbi:hypothetical protein RHGRI_011727 [Rhododendron griersonianum]|uniref:Maturase K n=1 Tax=Rhododendron griersonianum TaxID=479676 RepID=A0AAV6KNH7_9ERIC|nr:hypothetical protein RHGRI_011727 [Rhododendron griersonianum]
MMPTSSSLGRDQRSSIYIERQINVRIFLLELERNKIKTWWFLLLNHPRSESF